jgi:hypothetical protein
VLLVCGRSRAHIAWYYCAGPSIPLIMSLATVTYLAWCLSWWMVSVCFEISGSRAAEHFEGQRKTRENHHRTESERAHSIARNNKDSSLENNPGPEANCVAKQSIWCRPSL